jgi:hypothetical protein
MNKLKKSLQGPEENVLTSNGKILVFKRKLNLWKNHSVRGNLEMFPLPLGLESEEGYKQVLTLIENYLEEVRNKIKHYFPFLSAQEYDWVRIPLY